MNQEVTGEHIQIVNRYIAMWHIPDAEPRRHSISELYTEDASQFIQSREFHGYEALVERVKDAYEKFVKTEGFRFRLAGDVEAHHNAVKFSWEMVPAAGGEVAASGLIFLVLANDGRIHLDYQF